jgi:hypothetical protein
LDPSVSTSIELSFCLFPFFLTLLFFSLRSTKAGNCSVA